MIATLRASLPASRRLLRGVQCGFSSSVQQFTPEQLKGAHKYVEENMRSRTWVTYMLGSYFPVALRPAFYTLHLFDMELTKISQNSRQPPLALGKLDFWKDCLFKIYNRKLIQPEPLSIAMHHAINNNPFTYGYFTRMVSVRAHEISSRSLGTMTEMKKMADDSKGTLMALLLELLRIDITNEHVKGMIDYLGQAIVICEYIRRVPYSLRNDRFLLPEEILGKYNLTTNNIWDRVHGKPSEELFDGVLEIASHAKKAFEEAVRTHREDPEAFPEHAFRAFLRGVEAEYYLESLEKYNFNIFDQNLNNTSPVKPPYRVYNAAKVKRFYVGMQLKK